MQELYAAMQSGVNSLPFSSAPRPAPTTRHLLQFTVARDIIAQDGVGGLYKGLGAGLLRQATYTTGRLGMFQVTTDYLKIRNGGQVRGIKGCGSRAAASWHPCSSLAGVRRPGSDAVCGLPVAIAHCCRPASAANSQSQMSHEQQHARVCAQPLPLSQKAGAGLVAGAIGALIGSPADLSLIRMQSDSTLPPERRRNYKARSSCRQCSAPLPGKEHGSAVHRRCSTLCQLAHAMPPRMGSSNGHQPSGEACTLLHTLGWPTPSWPIGGGPSLLGCKGGPGCAQHLMRRVQGLGQ